MFTAKVQYALILLRELYAIHSQGNVGPAKLKDIAAKHGMKVEFLEQVARQLRKKGFVSALKGPGGGYVLGKKHGKTFIEIFECVQPDTDLKLAASGDDAQEYIKELHNEYLLLIKELEV